MPPPSKKEGWGSRPSKQTPPDPATVDAFVNGGLNATKSVEKALGKLAAEGKVGKMVRLNLDVPFALRARIKARCALKGREMRHVIQEILEQHFPE
jgi:hypothetical protein